MGTTQKLSTSTNSQVKMCKPQYASHIAIGVCKLSHISSYRIAKSSLKFKECPKVKWTLDVSKKGIFSRNQKI
jgi:hypothetical protein